jgi:hypothetical protein
MLKASPYLSEETFDEEGPPPLKPPWASERELILSLDLNEATYNMSHAVMDENCSFMDKVGKKFPPWRVFNKLFKIHKRSVDFSEAKRQGYYPEEFSEVLTTEHGCFMGDALSFIHLTISLSSVVDQATIGRRISSTNIYKQVYVKRPIGQSVGDDLILLGIDKQFANRFKSVIDQLQFKVSKLNAVSDDSGTFTEGYFFRPSLLDPDGRKIPKESIFGDLVFLDAIKGNLLTGKSKVKSDSSDPFLGHAKMLNKQIAYTPKHLNWRSNRAKVVLWAHNYRNAVKLGRSKPHLPTALGGLDIAVGACDSFESTLMQEKYLPYFSSLIEMNDYDKSSFLKYITLLSGIYRANPKGYPWENNEEIIARIFSKAEIVPERDVFAKIPFWLADKTIGEKLRYLNHELGYITVTNIANELSRREAFLNFWKLKSPKSFVTLTMTDARKRHDQVWKTIRNEVKPTPLKDHQRSFNILAHEIELRTFGLYVNRNDPAIAEVYEGMNSMHFWTKRNSS